MLGDENRSGDLRPVIVEGPILPQKEPRVSDHTLVACVKCRRGVRPRYAVCGMCHECAAEEIGRLRDIEQTAREIMWIAMEVLEWADEGEEDTCG